MSCDDVPMPAISGRSYPVSDVSGPQARTEPSRQRRQTTRYPRPAFRDWALLAINALFVICALIIMKPNPQLGFLTLAFFGSCGAVALSTITQKLRFRRFSAARVEVVGGVPIRPARGRLLLMSGWLAILGLIMLILGGELPLLYRICAGGILIAGAALFAGVLSGKLPRDFLQFDPDALTIGRWRWRARIPWDRIAHLQEAFWHDNPVLLIWVDDFGAVAIEPEEARTQVLKSMAWQPYGAHFFIMTTHYGFDLPVLTASIVTCVHDRSARDRLNRRGLSAPAKG